MHTKKYLVSTLLASTLVFGTPAMGQEKTLEPQGTWSISKVDRTAQGGNSYCTLSRKYDDGVVLSLGRNMAEEYSLALDFQKDIFEKDKSLKINLQPGPGKLRTYDLMPASQKAVVVRLGWDEGFFETLNQSQQMKVKIGEQSYAFAVPLIAKGQADLEDCMEGLKSASNGKPGPAPVVPSKDVLNAEPVQTSKAFDASRAETSLASAKAEVDAQEKKVLRDFAASMEEQEAASNGRRKSNINQAKAKSAEEVKVAAADVAPAAPLEIIPQRQSAPAPEKAADVARIEPAAGPSAAPAVDVSGYERRINDLRTENEALKAKVQAIVPQDTTKLASFEKQIAALTSENASLKNEISKKDEAVAKQSQSKQEVAALEKRIGELTAENSSLQNKASTLPQTTAQLAALEKRVNELNAENVSLSSKAGAIEQTTAKLELLQNKVAELSAENFALKDKNTVLATTPMPAQKPEEIASLVKSIQDLTAENAALKSKAHTSTTITALPEDDERIAVLEKRVTELSAENTTLKAAATAPAAGNVAPEKIAALEAKNKDLESKLEAEKLENSRKPDAADVADVQGKIKELEIKNAQLEDTLRKAQTRIAETAINTESKGLKTIAELQTKLEAAQADNIVLGKQLDDIKLQQDDGRMSLASGSWDLEQATKRFNESERETRRLAKALEQSRMSCNQEKSKIEQMLFDPAVADQQQIEKLSALEEELQQAKAQIGNPTQAVQAQIDAAVKAKTAELEAKIASLESAAAAPQAFTGISELPDSDPALVRKVAELEKSSAAINDQNILLRSEADKLRQQLADASTNGASRADRVATSQLELENLRRENALRSTQSLTYQNQIAALQQENSQLKTKLSVAGDARPATTAKAEAPVRPAPKPKANDRSAMAAQDFANIQPAAGSPSSAYDASGLKSLLQKAGVSASGIKKASGGLSGADNYSWSGGGGINGFSSVKSIGSSAEFDGLVSQYIASQKSQCGGDFASMPSDSSGSAGNKIAMYETACVGGAQSVSSSTLFFEDQGRFVAISSQTGADDMDVAMDSRDKIASVVKGL